MNERNDKNRYTLIFVTCAKMNVVFCNELFFQLWLNKALLDLVTLAAQNVKLLFSVLSVV